MLAEPRHPICTATPTTAVLDFSTREWKLGLAGDEAPSLTLAAAARYEHRLARYLEWYASLAEPPAVAICSCRALTDPGGALAVAFAAPGIQHVHVACQENLAVLASGRTTALLLNLDEDRTTALPVYKGYLVEEGVRGAAAVNLAAAAAVLAEAIECCPIDTRYDVAGGIIVAGSHELDWAALHATLGQRLGPLLGETAAPTAEGRARRRSIATQLRKLDVPDRPWCSGWVGGSMLGTIDAFRRMPFVTREVRRLRGAPPSGAASSQPPRLSRTVGVRGWRNRLAGPRQDPSITRPRGVLLLPAAGVAGGRAAALARIPTGGRGAEVGGGALGAAGALCRPEGAGGAPAGDDRGRERRRQLRRGVRRRAARGQRAALRPQGP